MILTVEMQRDEFCADVILVKTWRDNKALVTVNVPKANAKSVVAARFFSPGRHNNDSLA